MALVTAIDNGVTRVHPSEKVLGATFLLTTASAFVDCLISSGNIPQGHGQITIDVRDGKIEKVDVKRAVFRRR